MKVKNAKVLAARVRNSIRPRVAAVETSANDINFDPFEPLTNAIVQLAERGELEFLDPKNCRSPLPEFEAVFANLLKIEFGKDNGEFLFDRYKAGRVSPRMRRQIESIREHAASTFRRQHITANRAVLNTVASLYRKAYAVGGLPQVDQAIATLNSRLRLSGSRFGFGPGTACMEGESGMTEWIAVIFSDLDRDEFVFLEWCHLNNVPENAVC